MLSYRSSTTGKTYSSETPGRLHTDLLATAVTLVSRPPCVVLFKRVVDGETDKMVGPIRVQGGARSKAE